MQQEKGIQKDKSYQLTVYKASAGSGKTFTLAKEYMTLVIKDPMAYRTILAVTFTNKATEEMKMRILSKLYGIAHRLPDAKDYLEQIQEILGDDYSEQLIVDNAGTALSNLIHNYNYFRVETIDTFFQSVLRNLARELDLTANLRIGLNDEQVEQQAVDELIEELKDTDKLLFWIMEYIKENIADDKSWNVIGQIKNFGRHIFKDYYKDNAERLNECLNKEGFFEAFTSKMRNMQKETKEHFEQIAATFFDALEENGLTADDFQNKTRGIWSYFNKLRTGKFDADDLRNSTVEKCLESPEAWVKKSDAKPGNPAYDMVCSFMWDVLRHSEETRPKLLRIYKSTDLTLRHMNQLRLLGSIDRKVREMNHDANRFLLSDTQNLLHSLIQDSDSPFIFEKIGTQLEHVMIDEFQDTSTVQWKNFKVLLLETMSHENPANLIVGDVKQSIYRWRSGDWRLLNNIKEQFTPSHTIDEEPLKTNYRSDRNIIDFNNAFFVAAKDKEYEALSQLDDSAEQLKKAYDNEDVRQDVPKKKGDKGYVRIQLFAAANNKTSSEDGESYQDKMMRMTQETIQELLDKGVKYNKIAILARSNRIIQDIADYLMSHTDYPLVSDEAFRLDASQAVNLLVTALYHLTHPDDLIAQSAIRKFARVYLENEEIASSFFEQRKELLQEPLLDLAEKLVCHFHLNEIEQQSAYVCAFFDQLSTYLADNGSDIDDFLAEWDSSIHSKSIHSDKVDGIQLISIHKSKGLEFDNVIMPFCDWTMEKGDTIWCSPTEAPYNELPLVPVDFSSKKMMGSVYEQDYKQEHLQNMVDNLNLLYVAFTRAGRNLFVYGKRGYDTLRSHTIENSLKAVSTELAKLNEKRGEDALPLNYQDGGEDIKAGDVEFEYGIIDTETKNEDTKEEANVFLKKAKSIKAVIKTMPNLREFKPSQKSLDFIQGEDEDDQQQFYIKLGTVLHSLFSTIHTKDDVEKALKQLELDGVLYDENISKERIENMLRKRLNSDLVSDWFSDKWKVMNECNLLYIDAEGKVKQDRPDRVLIGENEIIVIDFKFGKPKPEYHDQVRGYMSQIKEMGHPNVKGYLWYVYPNKVEEVK